MINAAAPGRALSRPSLSPSGWTVGATAHIAGGGLALHPWGFGIRARELMADGPHVADVKALLHTPASASTLIRSS